MATTEITPFKGLRILLSKRDEKTVEHFIGDEEENFLRCAQCGGVKFEVKAIIEADLIVSKKEVVIVTERKNEKISVLKVVRCAVCGASTFSTVCLLDCDGEGRVEAVVAM